MVHRTHFVRTPRSLRQNGATFDLQPLRQAFKALAHLDVRKPAAEVVALGLANIDVRYC